ncbi:probable disease resistance protein At4g27220 isoform X1 [Camellia sinensis]|uniref:probable disease resistance protein At4g27220 isoform X1 n=2 Tax=Camellia sinensis TaxID=4442 RepID=UPI001035D7C8|nr:probable disease resistance protein At4g27220 isoform X1 [Camellia sinensis]
MAEGVGLSFLGKALGGIGEYLVAPIGRQFGYLFCFNTNIQNLETQLDRLKVTREGVQLGVDETRNNVRTVGPHLEAWLTKANDNTAAAETIIKDKAQVQKGCFNGWCPNLKLRYSLGRKAVKKTQELALLHAEGSNYIQSSYNPPPPSIEPMPTTTEFQGFDSRILVMNEIIEALKDDGIHLIGICGMGGMGKTTMAKEVANRTKNLFNEFPMAVVSQEPNLKQVQSCIAEMLGLQLDMENPILRSSRLRERLLQNDKKILVIFDDIWEEFDLEELGFPLEGGSNKSCKILFTSRNRNLWKGIQNKRYTQLQVLVGEEPWHLFREKVGDCADDLDLLPLAKQIVNECGGLPLALVTIGRALTNEHNQHHWNNALQQLRTPCSESLSSEVSAKVYQALYFSYNFLKDERAKKLFLLCCLFPEDYNITIEDLVRYGIGLRWFEGIDKVDEVRDRVNVLVDQLKSCYLLLDGRVEGQIKMHDLVRDVAISIAAKDKHGFMTIHGAKSREWPKKATYELYTSISVISNEIEEFPGGLTCSKLEFLLIECWNSSLKIPSNFFEGMGELKVLDLRITKDISLLLSSLQFLRNLLTLHLDYSQKFDNISVMGKLLNLEILTFRGSNIEELPEEIGGLVNLKLLDLTGCLELKRIAPGVISALVQLQELYMGGCEIIWEREGKEGGENASLREFESLSNLNTLEINIKDVVCLPRIPLFSKLTKYSILIGYGANLIFVEEYITRLRKLLSLRLLDTCTIPLECGGINSLLRSSALVRLREISSEDAVQELFREGVEGLQHLKDLLIDDCVTPECFVNTMEWVPRTPNVIPPIFPILEKLNLSNLPNLRKICHCQLPTGSFGKLKHLYIENCDRMEEVIWKEKGEDDATNKTEFQALESMTLCRLSMLVGFCRGTDEIEFPQLKKLRLRCLPQLMWLFLNSSNPFSESMENHNATFLSLFPHKVALPSLEELELKDLNNLEGLEHIPISVGSFSKLKKVHVDHCGKWLCVFSSQFLTRLRNLEDLTVENCSLLEKVFGLEMGDCKEQESEMLSLLKSLKLKCLPQLNYISKRDPIGFTYISQLNILHVHDCDNLRYLFPHSMKCMLQLQELDIRRCKMMSMIVADEKGQGKSSVDKIEFTQLKILRLYDLPILVSFFPKVIATSATSTECLQNVKQTLFNEKVVFPTLEVLELEHLDNLEGMGHCPPSLMSLSKLRYVRVRHCSKLPKVFQAQLLKRLQNLEELSIKDCSLLEKVFELEVVDCTEHNSKIFPLLKSLELKSLPQLNHISERHPIGFMYIPRLSILHIDDFDNLRFLFSQSMTQCVLQLQELNIRGCKMMSTIFREEDSHAEILVDNIEFTQLKILRLNDLQNLVSIFPKVTTAVATSFEHIQNPGQSLFNEKVAFPTLEELELHGFQSMNEIWCNQLQTGSFNKLIKLCVSDCGSLKNLFSPFMARYLVHLKELVINKCSMMEEVVAKEEDKEEGRINRTPLPKLEYLELEDLPELKSFCHVTHVWELPLVENITVLNCPEMKTFSPGVVCTPKLQRVFVKKGRVKWYPGKEGEDWLWISDLNQTILHLIKKQQQEQLQQDLQQHERRT